jgi:hypothetical protein
VVIAIVAHDVLTIDDRIDFDRVAVDLGARVSGRALTVAHHRSQQDPFDDQNVLGIVNMGPLTKREGRGSLCCSKTDSRGEMSSKFTIFLQICREV